MRLQTRLVLIIGSILTLLCLVIYIDAMFTLKHTYADQETNFIQKDIERTQKAIESQMRQLILYTIPWAQWDDAYQFMLDKNKKFITMNFAPATFINDRLNFVLFTHADGTLFYGEAYDLAANKKQPLPESLLNALSKNTSFLQHRDTASTKVGILNLPEGHVLISSLPVVTSNSEGPIRGTLLMGRYLTQADFNAINDITSLPTQFISLASPLNAPLQTVLLKLRSQSSLIQDMNSKTAMAYFRIDALNNEPAYLAETEIKRTFYNEGLKTIAYYLTTLITTGAIILLTLWVLLKAQIIDRVTKVSKQLKHIIEEGQFNKTIPSSGNDEISELITSINTMLTRIHETQGELKKHLSKRTQELEQVTELNRNLFTEVGQHKNTEARLLKEEELLKQMVYYDALTGLPSRIFFLEKLAEAIQRCPRASKIALFLIDMDHFKQLNVTHGHAFGDLVLKELSSRLQKILPALATPGRLVSDQWVVFVEKINDKTETDQFAAHLLQHLTEALTINDITLTPTFGLGISIYPDDSESIDTLLMKAELALADAKKKKGNSICYSGDVGSKKTPLTPL